MTRTMLDEYDQFAVLQVAGGAAGTGTTITQLVTGLTNMQKIAWEVSRIEFALPNSWIGQFDVAGDQIILGVTQSNNALQDLSLRGASMVDNIQLNVMEADALIGKLSGLLQCPIVHEFIRPVLVLPQMLFAFVAWEMANGLDTTPAIIRMWFKEKEITKEDWYDLLQLRLPLGAA